MKLAVLFSGGKDSCLAMMKAPQSHEIVCLISMISESDESHMFHVPNIGLTSLQGEAVGIPIITKRTAGKKEEELEDLKSAISEAKEKFGIDGIVTGAIRSVYQASRIQNICDELGLICVNPLWMKEQNGILAEVISSGIEAVITGVFAYPMEKELLGRMIDKDTAKILRNLEEKYDINPAGEGGEIETTVIDAPFFRKKIRILESETRFKNHSGVFVIKSAELAGK